MPLDSQGQYRHNHEAAQMHSEAAGKKYGEEEKPEGENMTEVHDHGDGTFHTVHGGEQTDHASIGAMHAHLSKTHGQEGQKHFHAHHDGMQGETHHVESGGEPESREHDMNNLKALKEHFNQFVGEEENEPEHESESEDSEQPEKKGLGSLY